MKTIAISQPRFLPAINYLQRIYHVDYFVILDNVQHQKQGFEHRNKIANGNKAEWASLRIDRSVTSRPIISNMRLANNTGLPDILNKCRLYYSDAPFFDVELLSYVLGIDTNPTQLMFTSYIIDSLMAIFSQINLTVTPAKFLLASELSVPNTVGPVNLLNICAKLSCTHYISGPNGRNYLDNSWPQSINVQYHDFQYPTYNRSPHLPIPWLCFLDPLFWAGKSFVREQIQTPLCLNNR